jgi:hypothetical protein
MPTQGKHLKKDFSQKMKMQVINSAKTTTTIGRKTHQHEYLQQNIQNTCFHRHGYSSFLL